MKLRFCTPLSWPLFFGLVASFLAGCATNVVDSNVAKPDQATVVGQIDRTRGFYHWRSFGVIRVNNESVSSGFMSSPHDSTVSLPSGSHRLVVLARINNGLGGIGTWQSVVTLPVTLEKGRTYRVNGDVSDATIQVWLEDPTTGTRLSEPASAPYRLEPKGAPVPIFIPTR